MTTVQINNWVEFAPNEGVMVKKEALKASPEELYESIAAALSHMNDYDLLEACGGVGPLKDFDYLPYEEYIAMKKTFDAVRAVNGDW